MILVGTISPTINASKFSLAIFVETDPNHFFLTISMSSLAWLFDKNLLLNHLIREKNK